MKTGMDQHVPPSSCTNCSKPLDGATSVGAEDGVPDPGDVTVCIYCGHIMAFDEDLYLRDLTAAEQIDVAGDERILAAQWARKQSE